VSKNGAGRGNMGKAKGGRRAAGGARLLKTGDVVELSGLSRQVIYQYQAIGLLKAVEVTPTGHRLYAESVLTHLKLIQNLVKSGYTLRAIKDIFFKDRQRRRGDGRGEARGDGERGGPAPVDPVGD